MPDPATLPITIVPAAVKPGWQTTEFWLTLALHLLTVLIASGVFPEGSVWAKVAALVMSALAQSSYSFSRGDLKGNAIKSAGVASLLICCLLPILAGGCQQSVSPAYLAADQATYAAIAPEYTNYVASDPKLSAEQIARRERTLATWKLRLDQASASQPGGTTTPASGAGAGP